MKRFKKLGVLLGVLVVLCIATLALTHYEEKQEAIKNSDAVILEIPTDAVTSLSWEYEEEGSLAFHKSEDGWCYDADEAFPVSTKKVNDILSHFEAFGVTFIIENVEDYSQYGLDEPECTLHIGTAETSYDIRLGAFSKMDQQRYIDIGDGNVYLVGQDPMEYVDSALSSMIAHDDTPGFETVVDITFTGSESYSVERLEASGYSYNETDVYFTQQDGVYQPLDTAAVTQYLNTVTSLELLDYATYNATSEELASYGLDDPELSVTIHHTYLDAEEQEVSDTCVFHISRNPVEKKAAQEAEARGEEAEDVTCYVRIGDSRIVYTVDKVDYAILAAAGYDDLRHREVFWADFSDVTRMDISLEGESHSLTSRLNEDGERVWQYPGEEADAVSGTVSSDAATETEAAEEPEALDISALQNALELLAANSFTLEAPTGKEEIRLTLHLDNENFPEVEIALYRYNGTECLAVVDGESVSLVPRSAVMALVEAVQAIVLN